MGRAGPVPDSRVMTRRSILRLSAGVVLAPWGVCVLALAMPGASYNWPVLGVVAGVALVFTACAAILIRLAWESEASVLAAVPASVVAAAVILVVAILIRSGGSPARLGERPLARRL